MSILTAIQCLFGNHQSMTFTGQTNCCKWCGKNIPTKCDIDGHTWITPTSHCGDHVHVRYGERVCNVCDRVESLVVNRMGGSVWICTKEVLNKVGKLLKV